MKKLSSFLLALLFTSAMYAQIPNPGFETWNTVGSYNVPAGWDNLNSMTTAMSTYTCTKGTPGYAGASYLQLISKTVTGLGVVPGIAVSGVMNKTTMQPQSGFAISTPPT